MDNLEKVEKLRKKADITYEEAREILEECDWDLLDAVIELEARGKIRNDSAAYSTEGSSEQDVPKSPKQVAESYQSYDRNKQNDKGFFKTLWDGFVFLLKKGCENTFVVSRDNRHIMQIPVLLLIILLLCSCFLVLVVMIVGLFFGFRYTFAGPDLGRDSVNNVMDKASAAADDLKESFRSDDAYPRRSASAERGENRTEAKCDTAAGSDENAEEYSENADRENNA